MTEWLKVEEAKKRFRVGRQTLMIDAQLAGARSKVGNGKKYIIDATALEQYYKTKRRG